MYIAISHIKENRIKKGMTIRALAARSGISREWIEIIEKQESPNLRVSTICQLSDALGIHPTTLVSYKWVTAPMPQNQKEAVTKSKTAETAKDSNLSEGESGLEN